MLVQVFLVTMVEGGGGHGLAKTKAMPVPVAWL
jgi:hypothetical protein